MPLGTGDAAPSFALPCAGGGSVALDALMQDASGGGVLLAFFKVDCPTCALTFPLVGVLQREVEPAVPVLAIGQERTTANLAWLRDHGYDGRSASDAYGNYRVARAYRVQTIPTLVLVNRDMRVDLAFEGWNRGRYNEIATRAAAMAGIDGASLLSAPGDGRPEAKAGCWARSRR